MNLLELIWFLVITEGLREKDKKNIGSVLSSVGTFNKDNSYSLPKSLYTEVKMNWPGYKEEDKKTLKR